MRNPSVLALLVILATMSACRSPGPAATTQQMGASGGSIKSSDGAVTVEFPKDAVPDDTNVTITRRGGPDTAPAGGQSVGAAYNVDLGGAKLSKPVTLEIAFQQNSVPDGSSAANVFLAFYDEANATWLPVAGHVDVERHVITVETDHLSWWNPFSWNWNAWIAVLDQTLSGNVTDLLKAAPLLTNDCPQKEQTVSVDLSLANNVIQGCVEHDDPVAPELRVVNPKSFFFEVRPVSGGSGYPPLSLLGPGDSLSFTASTSDPSPLVVEAEITQKAGLYLVVHLVLQMLPGLNQLEIQGTEIACITERLRDVRYFAAATEALLTSHDGTAAAEQLVKFFVDADAVRRFITASSDCSYGPASTWSVEGLNRIGAATATILSSTDFVANYLLNSQSRVAFAWTRPTSAPRLLTATYPPPPNDAASCRLEFCETRVEHHVELTFDPQGGPLVGRAIMRITTSGASSPGMPAKTCNGTRTTEVAYNGWLIQWQDC